MTMPDPLSLALRALVSNRLKSALAIIAVMLSTAVVAAAFTTNAAVEESMRAAALSLAGNADLTVEAMDDQGFPSAVVPAVRELPGVVVAAPQVSKQDMFMEIFCEEVKS